MRLVEFLINVFRKSLHRNLSKMKRVIMLKVTSEQQLDVLFRQCGGTFHGPPHVETATIPKKDYYRVCEELIIMTVRSLCRELDDKDE
jgi:hypothetical protein